MNLLKINCFLCKSISHKGTLICEHCQPTLPWNSLACHRCARPLKTETPQNLCGECLQKPNALDHCFAPLRYQQPISNFIAQLKFNKRLLYTKSLSQLFLEKCSNQTLPDIIIPVPLHAKRLRQRGFNQALELVKPISKKLKIPIIKYDCIRVKHTQAQSELPLHKRITNIKNAFQYKGSIAAKHVVIFDDVLTTGNTLNELAITLKQQGAETVSAWCIARAEYSRSGRPFINI